MKFLQMSFLFLLKILGKIINKKIIYVIPESLNSIKNTAVRDAIGFWYVGNLYNPTDIAYGIANRSCIKDEGTFVRNILEYLLSKDSAKKLAFYDIGANTGYFGILAGYVSQGRFFTHFFEPLPVHTDCIKETLYLNRLEKNATIHELGVGNENMQKTFYMAGSGSSLIANFSGSDVVDTCTIEVRKLNDYQKEKNLELPDFVKIDVEGNEYDVIEGGMEVFEKSKPVLYVEIAKDLKNIGRDFENNHFSDIFTLLKSIGYTAYRVSDDYEQVLPYVNDSSESGVHMYLFLHPDTHQELIMQYGN